MGPLSEMRSPVGDLSPVRRSEPSSIHGRSASRLAPHRPTLEEDPPEQNREAAVGEGFLDLGSRTIVVYAEKQGHAQEQGE